VSSRPLAGPTRRQWIVLVCLFLLSLPAVTPRLYSSDEIQYFAYLRSLWFDRDLSFENEYRHFYDLGIAKSEGFRETFLEMKTDTGRRINFGTIGCAILWSPFYAVGDLVARATGAPVDGFSKPYIAAVAYASAVYGFLSLLLALACTRRLGLNGFGAVLAIWFGTPLLFYMYVAPPFSHATSAFSVALFVYTWLRVRDTWSPRGAAALGAVGALMTMVREQDAFFVFGPMLDFLVLEGRPGWRLVVGGMVGRGPRRLKAGAWKPVLAAAAAFTITFTPQAAAYIVLNGHLGPHASVGHKMNWMGVHSVEVLFSPEHGYFVWTPLALIAIAGLFALARQPTPDDLRAGGDEEPIEPAWGPLRRRMTAVPRGNELIASCLIVMVALQIYIGGSVESWTVAGGFGQRRFVALTSILVIGLAAAARALAPSPVAVRRAGAAIIALAVYWNVALTAAFSIGLMDRQKLEPRRNAYDAFVTLPRMAPDLIYRYLFDRASFYQRHER